MRVIHGRDARATLFQTNPPSSGDVRITHVSCIIVRLVNLVVNSPEVNWKNAGTERRGYRAGKG